MRALRGLTLCLCLALASAAQVSSAPVSSAPVSSAPVSAAAMSAAAASAAPVTAAPVSAAPVVGAGRAAAGQCVDLAGATFTRNGAPTELAPRDAAGAPDADGVRLPCNARGVRWATTFTTEDAFTARLQLDWNPGPDGLLFELVLDGQRLSPVRDAWRPSPRPLSTDLGPAWLGRGSHLLELVAREQAPASALHVRALVLERL